MVIHRLFSNILLIQNYHTTCVSFSCQFSYPLADIAHALRYQLRLLPIVGYCATYYYSYVWPHLAPQSVVLVPRRSSTYMCQSAPCLMTGHGRPLQHVYVVADNDVLCMECRGWTGIPMLKRPVYPKVLVNEQHNDRDKHVLHVNLSVDIPVENTMYLRPVSEHLSIHRLTLICLIRHVDRTSY